MKRHLKWIIPVALAFTLSIGFCVYKLANAIYIHSLTHITMTDEDEEELFSHYIGGYGFPYEYGWSSVDLWPYHIDNDNNVLVRVENPSFTISDKDKMPILDGAEAAYPVYSAFALNCYDDVASFQNKRTGPVIFTNTIEAYKKLLSGEVDIFFGARPSEAQKTMAEEQSSELVMTPLAQEAFVFFVSKDNPIDNISSEDLRKIYSGEYTSWKSVGGKNIPILAFQRPENSGSQTMMQYFMGDTPLKQPLEVEYEMGMGGVLSKVANYQNKASSIGYSFRYYSTKMANTYKDNIKFLSIDGIAPTEENIASGKYPLTTTLYAITLKENQNEYIEPFLDWMQSEQGKQIISETGYVIR